MNIWLVSTIHPHKCVDVAKSHDDLPVATRRNSSNIGHVPRESPKSAGTSYRRVPAKYMMCIVSGDRRRRETGWFGRVSAFSGGYLCT